MVKDLLGNEIEEDNTSKGWGTPITKDNISEKQIKARGGIHHITENGMIIFNSDISAISTISKGPKEYLLPNKVEVTQEYDDVIILKNGMEWDLATNYDQFIMLDHSNSEPLPRTFPKGIKKLEDKIKAQINFIHGNSSNQPTISERKIKYHPAKSNYHNATVFPFAYINQIAIDDNEFTDCDIISGEPYTWGATIFVAKFKNGWVYQVLAGSSDINNNQWWEKWLWGSGYMDRKFEIEKEIIALNPDNLGKLIA